MAAITFSSNGWDEQFLPFLDPHPTNDSYLHQIKQALSHPSKVDFMKEAYFLKGGWEGWLQVELAVALKRQAAAANLAGVVIEREKLIWPAPSQDRVDLWFRTGDTQVAGFELKCRNVNTHPPSNAAGFGGQVMIDIGKVDTAPTPVPAANGTAIPRVMYAVGITNDPTDLVQATRQNSGAKKTPWSYGKQWQQKAGINWCYLHRGAEDIAEDWDAQQQATINNPVAKNNIYMVWYKV